MYLHVSIFINREFQNGLNKREASKCSKESYICIFQQTNSSIDGWGEHQSLYSGYYLCILANDMAECHIHQRLFFFLICVFMFIQAERNDTLKHYIRCMNWTLNNRDRTIFTFSMYTSSINTINNVFLVMTVTVVLCFFSTYKWHDLVKLACTPGVSD